MALTPNQYLVKETGKYSFSILSMFGAAMILSSVFRSEKNRKNIQQRIVASMCMTDFVFEFMLLTGVFWMPKSKFLPNVGNAVSCGIQGFFGVWAWYATIWYNCSLAVYYLLVIKCSWNPRKVKDVEKWFHIVPHAVGLGFSVAASFLDGFNSAGPTAGACLLYPNKNRGDDYPNLAHVERMIYASIAMFSTCIFFNSMCYLVIYWHVRETEKRSERWGGIGLGDNRLVRTRIVATQCKLYSMVFLCPMTLYFLHRLLAVLDKSDPVLEIISKILLPSAGFLNAIVYFRMRFNKYVTQNPRTHKVRIVRGIIRETLFPCCCKSFQMKLEEEDKKVAGNQSTCSGNGHDLEPILNHQSTAYSEMAGEDKEANAYQVSSLRTKKKKQKQKQKKAVMLSNKQIPSTEGSNWKELRAKGVRAYLEKIKSQRVPNQKKTNTEHTSQEQLVITDSGS